MQKKIPFTIVTATAGQAKTWECTRSWAMQTRWPCGLVVIRQGEAGNGAVVQRITPWVSVGVPDYLGPVPAFALGVDLALQITADYGIIACLHDDLLIEEDGWDQKVLEHFAQHPACGLLGFGGAKGLGREDIYRSPYDPMQLARQDFVSNMRDAEVHGRRVTEATEVACLDGFSQIGRVAYWRGWHNGLGPMSADRRTPLRYLADQGLVHHAYDAALGAFARRWGWQVWMLPVACHHYGGQTAVGDAQYQAWANKQVHGTPDVGTVAVPGDQRFWDAAHRIVYDEFRGELPIRVE